MPIKPIDFQVMMPKTSEVSKIHSDEQNKGALLQQQQATTVQNKAEANIRQVYSQEKAQEARIKEKQEKNTESQPKEKKKGEGKKTKGNYSSKKESPAQAETSYIDVRL